MNFAGPHYTRAYLATMGAPAAWRGSLGHPDQLGRGIRYLFPPPMFSSLVSPWRGRTTGYELRRLRAPSFISLRDSC